MTALRNELPTAVKLYRAALHCCDMKPGTTSYKQTVNFIRNLYGEYGRDKVRAEIDRQRFAS